MEPELIEILKDLTYNLDTYNKDDDCDFCREGIDRYSKTTEKLLDYFFKKYGRTATEKEIEQIPHLRKENLNNKDDILIIEHECGFFYFGYDKEYRLYVGGIYNDI
jgi:hypothetical protein